MKNYIYIYMYHRTVKNSVKNTCWKNKIPLEFCGGNRMSYNFQETKK